MYIRKMFQGQKTRILVECCKVKISVMDMPIVNPYTIFNKFFTNGQDTVGLRVPCPYPIPLRCSGGAKKVF